MPVIVLAPTSDPVERVRALDRGADDVLGRPFAYEELLARIRALLRRSSAAQGDVIVAGDLVIDRPTRRVRVRETAVLLSAKEFELVAKLASDPYRVFTKEQLLREVWGYRALGRTRTLESHASRVRKKLCVGPDDRFIVERLGRRLPDARLRRALCRARSLGWRIDAKVETGMSDWDMRHSPQTREEAFPPWRLDG